MASHTAPKYPKGYNSGLNFKYDAELVCIIIVEQCIFFTPIDLHLILFLEHLILHFLLHFHFLKVPCPCSCDIPYTLLVSMGLLDLI